MKLEPKHFKRQEFDEIIEKSKQLMGRGYFTGINFIQSEKALPEDSIVIHFLHSSQTYLENLSSQIKYKSLIVPRYTYYLARKEYFSKTNFRDEYSNAIFLDKKFGQISMDDAINNPEGVTILNGELDLIIPFDKEIALAKLIAGLRRNDRVGLIKWIDPVVIIKTNSKIRTLNHFFDKHYVSITKGNEEFYSILTDDKRAKALENYLNNLCVGNTRNVVRSDIVFSPSQINQEFNEYLNKMQIKLKLVD